LTALAARDTAWPVLIAAIVGLVFGFIGSIPVAGPISALVLHRALDRRFKSATGIGIGGAVVEGVYAFLSFYGFSKFLANHPWMDPVSRALAAVILFGLGFTFFRYKTKPSADSESQPKDSIVHSLALGATVTAINPTLIATWSATAVTLFSSGLIAMTPDEALPFAAGATCGIGGWFVLFVVILRRYGARFRPATLEKVVRGIGLALMGLSLFFVYRFVAWLVK
jgi:threonine/homoserine/homoserine lactone efflux protein